MTPRPRLWQIRYYDEAGNLLRHMSFIAPTKTLVRLGVPPLLMVPHAVRRTIATR